MPNSSAPTTYNYDDFLELSTTTPTTVSDIDTESGVYLIDGDHELENTTVPNDYDDETFNHVYFINGDLTITKDIDIDTSSTALYIVNGSVNISKGADTVGIAIFTDGEFHTAYDREEDQATSTLELFGVYAADNFFLERTLQGTNNTKYPSESFRFEPKYITKMDDYFGTSTVHWLSVD
ncbi:hypothetical protein OAL67_01200 [bacterium]|nr:hypothetical protein [bacterium]